MKFSFSVGNGWVRRRGIELVKYYLYLRFVSMSFYIGMHIHGLAHAASGYHKVLEENRKLYNQVQDLKGKLLLCIKKIMLFLIM